MHEEIDFSVLNAITAAVSANAENKGFRDPPGGLPREFYEGPEGEILRAAVFMSNMHGETSEFWEAARAKTLGALCDKADKMVKLGLDPLTCAEEELADIIIRALDTAAQFGVDPAKAVRVKMAYNAQRPHRHGGKLALAMKPGPALLNQLVMLFLAGHRFILLASDEETAMLMGERFRKEVEGKVALRPGRATPEMIRTVDGTGMAWFRPIAEVKPADTLANVNTILWPTYGMDYEAVTVGVWRQEAQQYGTYRPLVPDEAEVEEGTVYAMLRDA